MLMPPPPPPLLLLGASQSSSVRQPRRLARSQRRLRSSVQRAWRVCLRACTARLRVERRRVAVLDDHTPATATASATATA